MKPKKDVNSMKILVTDDERDIRTTLHQLLTYNGHDVGVASNGQECLDTLNEAVHDVLFLDVMMPGMDGIEVAQKVKQMDKRPKVVFLTVKQPGEIDMSLADSFIQKPFEIDDVLDALK